MAKDLFRRYIWLVDTIRRYGRISRHELDECWRRSPFSDGDSPLPRRTFYNYRQAVAELFNIEIECDPSTYDYFIRSDESANAEGLTDWLLNTAAMSEVAGAARAVADRVFVEDVPSAREHLSTVIEALRDHHPLCFSYHPYYRTLPSHGVIVEPYFLKIFRQRWYMTGLHREQRKVKTYALDRMSDVRLLPDVFADDPTFDPESYFRDSFGIVVSSNETKRIALRTDPRQAKYFRALPLHHSQEEVVHDRYSIFYYRMRISPDLVEELLSHGARVEVLEPPELRAMMRGELRDALALYGG